MIDLTDLHFIPRVDYLFKPAPISFILPFSSEDGEITTDSSYWQGIYMIALLFWMLAVLIFLIQIGKYCVKISMNRSYGYVEESLGKCTRSVILSLAFVFLFINVLFFILADRSVINMARVANDSFDYYNAILDQCGDLDTTSLELLVHLNAIQSVVQNKALYEIVNQITDIMDQAQDILSQASNISWSPNVKALELSNYALVIHSMVTFVCMILLINACVPKLSEHWCYRRGIESFNFIALLAVWIYLIFIFTGTVPISDICYDVPSVILQVEDHYVLDNYERDIVDYYVQCAPGAVPPFNEALMNIENAMHATSLLMGILDVFYDMHPDLRPDINAVHKLYAQDSDIVDALLSHSNCKPVSKFYIRANKYFCNGALTNLTIMWITQFLFLCMIFLYRQLRITIQCQRLYRNAAYDSHNHPLYTSNNSYSQFREETYTPHWDANALTSSSNNDDGTRNQQEMILDYENPDQYGYHMGPSSSHNSNRPIHKHFYRDTRIN